MAKTFKRSRSQQSTTRKSYNYRPQNSLASEERTMYTRVVLTFFVIIAIATSLYFWGTDIVIGIGNVWLQFLPQTENTVAVEEDVILPPRIDPLPTYTNAATITVHGWSQAGKEVQLYLNNTAGQTILTDSTGRFEYLDMELGQGENSVYAVTLQGDRESKPSNQQVVVLDTIAPTLTVNISEADTDGLVSVSGQSEQNSTVFINGHRVILLSDGGFSDSIQLQEGDNQIEVKSIDRAGNEEVSTQTRTYTKVSDTETSDEPTQ